MQRAVDLRDFDMTCAAERHVGLPTRPIRAFVAAASKRNVPCVSPMVASPTRSSTFTLVPRGTVTRIFRLSVFGVQSVEKLNHLCQSQTDSFRSNRIPRSQQSRLPDGSRRH